MILIQSIFHKCILKLSAKTVGLSFLHYQLLRQHLFAVFVHQILQFNGFMLVSNPLGGKARLVILHHCRIRYMTGTGQSKLRV